MDPFLARTAWWSCRGRRGKGWWASDDQEQGLHADAAGTGAGGITRREDKGKASPTEARISGPQRVHELDLADVGIWVIVIQIPVMVPPLSERPYMAAWIPV